MPTTTIDPTPEEMQKECPEWWAQHVDGDLKPKFTDCVKMGQDFRHCSSFACKATCWARWSDQRREQQTDGGKNVSDIKEQLETTIAGMRSIRKYYEDELPEFAWEYASRLMQPGEMIRFLNAGLDPLQRALSGIIREEKRTSDHS